MDGMDGMDAGVLVVACVCVYGNGVAAEVVLLRRAAVVVLAGVPIKLKSVAVELLSGLGVFFFKGRFFCTGSRQAPFSSPTLARGSEPASSSSAPFDGRYGCFLRTELN